MNKEEIPCIFYCYIHYKLREKYQDAIITTKEAMSFLFEWRLPGNIRPIIIKELELLNLVEKINKKTIKLKPSPFNPNDVRKFYEELEIY